jgi:hypothetical protein
MNHNVTMSAVGYWILLLLATVTCVAAGSVFRQRVFADDRRLRLPALICLGAAVALLVFGRGNQWRMLAIGVILTFVLVTRFVTPWIARRSRPTVTRPLHELRDALVDLLVSRPRHIVQVECYEDYAIVHGAFSSWDTVVGGSHERFDYAAACVYCEIIRGLEAVEAAAAPGMEGVAARYRERLETPPKFVPVFRPRHPSIAWQWGRDVAAHIKPDGLCAVHTSAAGTGGRP